MGLHLRTICCEPHALAAGILPVHLNMSQHVVLRVQVPDRPGALGAVASRIGAVGGDITDVTVNRRDGGRVVDEFHVTLPGTAVDVVALLTHELDEVDGAIVESCAPATCCGEIRSGG